MSSDDSTEEKAGKQAAAKRKKQPVKKATNATVARHSSLRVTGKTTPTIVGPIHEWECCPENLPNHPTMVSTFLCA